MLEGEQSTVNEAKTTLPPAAEVITPPEGPSVAELQARIAGWETRYKKEIGDRDKGMARQAETLKELQERLELAEKSADALARKTFGVDEEQTESDYQKWQRQHKSTPKEKDTQNWNPTPEHLEASGQMKALARIYKVDFGSPPTGLADDIKKLTPLYYSDNPQEAVDMWEAALIKRDNELKAKAETEAKSKREEAEKRAKAGTRDTSTSTGGGTGDWKKIRDDYIAHPNDLKYAIPYFEARKARGI